MDMDAVSVVLSAVVGGGAAGIFVQVAKNWETERRLTAIEGQFRTFANANYGAKGRAIQSETEEEMQLAMIEAFSIFKDGGIVDKTAAIMGLAAKYPRVAAMLAKKGMKLI
jgi:hypothetical protein